MLQGIISAYLLSNFEYNPNLRYQSNKSNFGIFLGYIIIPSIFHFLMGFSFIFYKLQGNYLDKINNTKKEI
jgi:Na+/melibiose symporter-like transporter